MPTSLGGMLLVAVSFPAAPFLLFLFISVNEPRVSRNWRLWFSLIVWSVIFVISV